MDETTKNQIKSLLLKGFNKEEISKLLSIKIEDIDEGSKDIKQNTFDLYGELQKDLSKLVMTELQKKEARDNQVILNAIKLQADLQEKKVNIMGEKKAPTTISKDYIYDRDSEIAELKKTMTEQQIAERLGLGTQSVKQAIDRFNLNLPEELKTLSPTIISETNGLSVKDRHRVLGDAYKNKYTRKEVREIVNSIKNEGR
jgi:hypothetical protein